MTSLLVARWRHSLASRVSRVRLTLRTGFSADFSAGLATGTASGFSLGDRVFHQKFGYGKVARIDGNKLTIVFEKAGEKKVIDSFVERL